MKNRNNMFKSVEQWLAKLRYRRGVWPFELVALFSLIIGGCSTAQASMIDVCRAAVRVSTDVGPNMKGYGSGGIVGADDESYLVVTCEHVANKATATVEIVRFGQPIKTVRGTVVGRDAKSDCAFIRVKKSDLGGVVPGLLPIDAAFELKPGDLLWGASYPEGGSLTIFEMSYIGMTADGWIEAKPSIKQGRSGGIVVDADGTRVIGITWGTSKDRCFVVPAKRFAKAVGKELTNIKEPTSALDFTVADKSLFNRRQAETPHSILNNPNRQNQLRKPWILSPRRQRPNQSIVPNDQTAPNAQPNGPIQPSVLEPEPTQLKIRIGDISVEQGKPNPEPPKPAPPAVLPPNPYWRPFPPFGPGHGPGPAPIPAPLPPPGPRPQFRGQSYATGNCPGGTCPTPLYGSAQETRPKSADVKPSKPLPVATPETSTLPDPESVASEEPKKTGTGRSEPLPIYQIQDPRLEKIVGIEQTVFGLQSGQSGIEKKVDAALEKVGQLIDEKKDAVKIDLEAFRSDTLHELDSRVQTLQTGIDERLVLVSEKLATLEATNERIAELKQSIDNFSVFPSAGGLVAWAKEWGWFTLMVIAIAVLGGVQGWQFYKSTCK